MPTRVDAHLHLWDVDRLDYPWLDEEPDLNRTQWAEEYLAVAPDPLPRSVFVQADCLPSQGRAEVDAIASIADRVGIVGAVAFAPVDIGADVEAYLLELQTCSLVRGIRFILQDRSSSLLRERSFLEGVAAVGAAGLPFDLCIRNHQIEAATKLVADMPRVQFVLDHLGKPHIDGDRDEWEKWRRDISALASNQNVTAKLSGLSTEASGEYRPEMVRPFFEHALEAFGPERLMLGSDWPVSTLATSYSEWWATVDEFLSGLGESEREDIAFRTAERVYRLD